MYQTDMRPTLRLQWCKGLEWPDFSCRRAFASKNTAWIDFEGKQLLGADTKREDRLPLVEGKVLYSQPDLEAYLRLRWDVHRT